MKTPSLLVIAVLSLNTGCATLSSSSPSSTPFQTVQIHDAELASGVHELETRSPAFRKAMKQIRSTKLPVFLINAQQAKDEIPSILEDAHPHWVGFTILSMNKDQETINAGVIVVDLERLKAMYEGHPEEYRDELLSVLAHEVYGHLSPVFVTGSLRDRCNDPDDEHDPSRNINLDRFSCAMIRENWIRKQIGLPPKLLYGVPGPSVQAEDPVPSGS